MKKSKSVRVTAQSERDNDTSAARVLEEVRDKGCAILAYLVTGKISDVHFGVMVCSSHTPHERAQATTLILKRTSAYGRTHDASLLNKGQTNRHMRGTQGHPGGSEEYQKELNPCSAKDVHSSPRAV